MSNQPTPFQIRAALAGLNWGYKELSKACGLSIDAISFICLEKHEAREDSRNRIRYALEQNGIEFIGDRGVAVREDTFRRFEGEEAYLRLLDEIFHTLHGKEDAQACFFFIDNNKSSPEVVSAHRRLRESGISCRYLCHEKPGRIDFEIGDYRGVPDRFFKNGIQVVYGDYVGLVANEEPLNVLIIKSRVLAEATRSTFEMLWLSLQLPEKGTK